MILFSTVAAVLYAINCGPVLKWIYQMSVIRNTIPNPYIHTSFAFITFFLVYFFFFLFSAVSDLQEEGKNAINAPMNPSAVDIHPEDTLLGKVLVLQRWFRWVIISSLLNVDCPVGTERIGSDNWKRLHVTCRLKIKLKLIKLKLKKLNGV